MKLMMLRLAGVVAASALAPVQADAQRWHGGRSWHGGFHDGGRYHYAPRRHYGGGYHRGWRRGGWGGRTVCRWRHGRYGAVRRCYRVRW